MKFPPEKENANKSIAWKVSITTKKLYGPFLWIGLNCLKATEPQRGDSLLFITKSPVMPELIWSTWKDEGCVDLGATQWFWARDPWIGNPAPTNNLNPFQPQLNPLSMFILS